MKGIIKLPKQIKPLIYLKKSVIRKSLARLQNEESQKQFSIGLGRESCKISAKIKQKVQTFQNKCLKKILDILAKHNHQVGNPYTNQLHK